MPKENIDFHKERHLLDVFYPDTADVKNPVIIFIHGGSWYNGDKNIYSKFGINFAEKGVVSSTINYRLAPEVTFERMAADCAAAVKWVYENIATYYGDPDKIFLCGHSAGGHLAALISLNDTYFKELKIQNPVKGCILIDAFGLNIYKFINDHGTYYMEHVKTVFTEEPEKWKAASPVNFIEESDIPFLIFSGDKSYPFLTYDNEVFAEKMKAKNKKVQHEVQKNKTHIQMIRQFEKTDNPIYDSILEFTSKKLH